MQRRALLLGSLLLVMACGGGNTQPYPAEVADNFMRGCTARTEPATCQCALDKLQARFSVDQFKGFEARMRQGEVPQEMVDAASACR